MVVRLLLQIRVPALMDRALKFCFERTAGAMQTRDADGRVGYKRTQSDSACAVNRKTIFNRLEAGAVRADFR